MAQSPHDSAARRHPVANVSLLHHHVHRPQRVAFLYRAALGGRPRVVHQCDGVSPPSSPWLTAADVDVPPRRLAALPRQHALPLDLRRQRRGSARPRALLRLLPALRRGRGAGPRVHQPDLEDPDHRRERRHRRRDGRLLRALSALARAGARAAVHHLGNRRGPRHLLPRPVVRDAVLQRRGSIADSPDSGGVAFWAHVAGFAAGSLAVLALRKPSNRHWA